jgi:hypothetical protein
MLKVLRVNISKLIGSDENETFSFSIKVATTLKFRVTGVSH